MKGKAPFGTGLTGMELWFEDPCGRLEVVKLIPEGLVGWDEVGEVLEGEGDPTVEECVGNGGC